MLSYVLKKSSLFRYLSTPFFHRDHHLPFYLSPSFGSLLWDSFGASPDHKSVLHKYSVFWIGFINVKMRKRLCSDFDNIISERDQCLGVGPEEADKI
jgi:hypothetical protein